MIKPVIVIPAYNEEKSISKTVLEAKKFCDVLVVDDCSKDQTGKLAIESGAIVVRNEINSGYDKTIDNGFKKALDLGYSHVITFDADGQHPASAIPLFIKKFEEGYDVVFGVRQKKQRIAETLFALYTGLKFRLHDPLSGLKGYSLAYYKLIGAFDTFKSIGTELGIKSIILGAKYIEVNYQMNDREEGVPRFGSIVSGNVKILKALLKSIKTYR